MKSLRTLILLFVLGMLAVPIVYLYSEFRAVDADSGRDIDDDDDADLPPGIRPNKEHYLNARTEHIGMLRGWDTAEPDSREKAVTEMESSERTLPARGFEAQAGSWTPLGPAPIPVNSSTAFSGRVTAIAVHPTNPNIVYVGTAQGGLYRTLNGGITWTPLMDSALTLAIGAVAIASSDPSTVFVGTGESTLCGSGCYIGVGLYRITNADTNPTLLGPLNKDTSNTDVFTGRSVSEVIISPLDPNIIFASTTSGIAGMGNSTTGLPLPNAGIFRSTNAMSTNPTFQKLSIQGTGGGNRNVTDLAIEPGNPSRLLAGVVGASNDGGVYLSTNALDAVPTFARTLVVSDGGTLGRTELAVNKVGGVVTVYAATGMASGTVSKSTDGGASFPTSVTNGFCGNQCFYDIGIAVDPTDASKVYLGGNPNMTFGRSTNGGASFIENSTNLHSDTQTLAVAPSDPYIVYFGSDGGIWKTTNVNAPGTISWTSLNNSSFSASQFMSIALHPTDRNFLLGGTQDNGTLLLSPNGMTWMRTDLSDGGFAVIDQNAVDVSNVFTYHTYFNTSGSLMGFVRSTGTDQSSNPQWTGFYGCGGTPNGINCADQVLFYAPLVGGPNAPGSIGNTLYYGTNRLYRSINQGTTMSDVSGTLPARISAIAISPQNDDIRLVGTTAGTVHLSTTGGATTMANITGPIPTRYIGRVAIDPANQNVAYVALNGFGLASGQHVWKTINLLSGSPTWVAAGNGIPDVPVNAFAVNPNNSQDLFAGTDIGVFRSTDGGANWIPFSNGLPRVAVFGLEISKAWQVVKIATHGRGIWEYNLAAAAPTRRTAFDYDGDGKSDVSVFRPSNNIWYLNRSTAGFTGYQFGAAADILAPADFTGDGKTDVAVFRPSSGMWFVMRSEDNTFYGTAFGMNGDIPAPADYDGDGKADLAVFRPSGGTWYLQRTTSGFSATQFGTNGDVPTIGDFDGDGKSDIALYRPSGGTWYRLNSSSGSFFAIQFGAATDKVVPADYTGDGKTDIAVWRPSNGTWYILRSEDGSFYGSAFGGSGDLPVPGDYDGDGKADIGVFRPSQGTWYELRSASGFSALQFGMAGDKPTPNSIVY